MLDETVVPGPLLQYKNTSRLARGDDVTTLSSVIRTETHQDAARTRSQAYVDKIVRFSLACVFGLPAVCRGFRK